MFYIAMKLHMLLCQPTGSMIIMAILVCCVAFEMVRSYRKKNMKMFNTQARVYFILSLFNLYLFLIDFTYVTSCINKLDNTFLNGAFIIVSIPTILGIIGLSLPMWVKKS